jgi:hypothetical protein
MSQKKGPAFQPGPSRICTATALVTTGGAALPFCQCRRSQQCSKELIPLHLNRRLGFGRDDVRCSSQNRRFSLFSAYRVGERVLAWVAEVAENPLHASDNTPDAALASAAFRYIRLARFAYGGNLGQPGLARLGKFREVLFDAGTEATLAGLNSGTLRLDIGCTSSHLPPLLRHCNGCGKQYRGADYYEALHHRFISSTNPLPRKYSLFPRFPASHAVARPRHYGQRTCPRIWLPIIE